MTGQPKDTRLWCLHHIGPDDMHPAPDFATAQKWADYSNRAFAKYADMSRFVVALWPWAAAMHSEGLELKDWTLPEQPSHIPASGKNPDVADTREAIAQAVLKGIYGQAWDAFQFPEGWDWGEKIADMVLDAIRALPLTSQEVEPAAEDKGRIDFLDMRRPIKGIEYRSAEEVFAIMADRIRLAEGGHYRLRGGTPAEPEGET